MILFVRSVRFKLNFRTKQLVKWLWPFLIAWGIGYAVQLLSDNPEIDFAAGLGLVATFAVFAWWINKKLKLVEHMQKTGKFHVSGNIQFLRLIVFATIGMLALETVADYFQIETARIPMLVLIGMIITGYLVGYFPSMPKDNEFRGKR